MFSLLLSMHRQSFYSSTGWLMSGVLPCYSEHIIWMPCKQESIRMGEGTGGGGTQVGINKTLVKELVWTLWHHRAFYSGSQRVLFLNELKSHLPLSRSIRQATSWEFLTWNYLFAYTTSWAQFHVWDIYLKAPLIYYLFLSGNPFSNSPSPSRVCLFIYLASDFFAWEDPLPGEQPTSPSGSGPATPKILERRIIAVCCDCCCDPQLTREQGLGWVCRADPKWMGPPFFVNVLPANSPQESFKHLCKVQR